MAEQENNQTRTIQIPNVPDNSNIRIHVDQGPQNYVQGRPLEKRDISKRTIMSAITGFGSGLIAWIGAHFYSQDKMLPYEAEYQKRSVDMIMGKGGLGAAAAEAGTGFVPHPAYMNGSTLGNLGPGMSGALIENSVATNMLLENPEKYSFARWMRRIGGKSNFNMAVGVGVGAAVGLATYAAMSGPEKKHADNHGPDGKEWKDKVETDKDTPRTLS